LEDVKLTPVAYPGVRLERYKRYPSRLEAVDQGLADRCLACIVGLKTHNEDLPRHLRHSGNILLLDDIFFEATEQEGWHEWRFYGADLLGGTSAAIGYLIILFPKLGA
jgi:hypothetical protein